jgi:hypothetical protein
VCQNRLGLIVGGMSDCDPGRATLCNHSPKECVAKASPGLFEIPLVAFGFSRYVLPRSHQLQLVLVRQFRDKLSIAIRFPTAQAVIEVDNE